MDPGIFFADIVQPSLLRLQKWTGLVSDDRGHLWTMTAAGQETGWAKRLQDVPVGVVPPARSYWQFELGGGVAALFGHPRARPLLENVLRALDVPAIPKTVHEAMAWNDTLACCMARLLLWTDPAPLPGLTERDAGWDYYQRLWCPGAPRPESWPLRYSTAVAVLNDVMETKA